MTSIAHQHPLSEFPEWSEILDVLTLQAGYNAMIVVIGTTLLGLAAGGIGSFVLLRKRALMSDALAHSALPGICGAFLLAHYFGWEERNLLFLLFGATLSGLLGVVVVQFLIRQTRLTEDTAIGAVLSVFFGVGVVLLSIIQNLNSGSAGGLHHFLYGQTAAMQQSDAVMMGSVAFAVILLSLVLLKEFRLVCFDAEYAQVQGWPVSVIDFLLMAGVVAVTVVGLQAVGIILVVALLVVPPAAARFWTERLSVMSVLAAFFGALAGYIGSSLSALLPRLPAGAVIVLCAGAIFIVSFFLAPRRGLLAHSLRALRLRFVIARDHSLRALHEATEIDDVAPRKTLTSIPAYQSVPILMRLFLGYYLRFFGLITADKLSKKGMIAAQEITYKHRLWEAYLVRYGALATTHVDFSADRVEHVLDKALVEELENLLRDEDILSSVHPLGVGA